MTSTPTPLQKALSAVVSETVTSFLTEAVATEYNIPAGDLINLWHTFSTGTPVATSTTTTTTTPETKQAVPQVVLVFSHQIIQMIMEKDNIALLKYQVLKILKSYSLKDSIRKGVETN